MPILVVSMTLPNPSKPRSSAPATVPWPCGWVARCRTCGCDVQVPAAESASCLKYLSSRDVVPRLPRPTSPQARVPSWCPPWLGNGSWQLMPILGALTPCAASHHRHTLSSLQPRTCPTSPQRPATTSATSTLRLLSITLSGHHGGTWTHLPRAPQAIQELRPGVVIAHAVVPRSCQSAVARPLLQTQHRLRSRFAAPQPADAGALVKGWTTDALRLRRRSQYVPCRPRMSSSWGAELEVELPWMRC